MSTVPSANSNTYASKCTRINVPEGKPAKSIVYSSDGANQENCYLNLYNNDGCTGSIRNEELNDDVSSCVVGDVRYARLFCNKQVRARHSAATLRSVSHADLTQ